MIRLFQVYYTTRSVLLVLGEAALVASVFLLSCYVTLGQDTSLVLIYEDGWIKIGAITVITVMLSYYFDLYETQDASVPFEIYFRIVLVAALDCFVVAVTLFLLPSSVLGPRTYALGLILLTPVLILWRFIYERVGGLKQFREKVYLLGGGKQAALMAQTIRSRRDLGMEVVGWEVSPDEKALRRANWVNALDRMSSGELKIHRIIVAMEDGRQELPVEQLLNVRWQGIQVDQAADLLERLSGKITLEGLRPSAFLYTEGFRIKRSQQMARQLISMIAAVIGLLIFLPFFPFVVLMIRLTSKGPIFFKQTRVGVGGHTFHVYKFRSMFTDAEAAGARWATKNDPRVTKFGMLMRKTRIDEVPQLWNILRGDMGFVGPRPERPEFTPMLAEQLPFYYLRHLVRPGLTGWAQVRYGYGATLDEMRTKLEYDLYYVKHMSLGLDLLIMFETVKTILRRRGAQ